MRIKIHIPAPLLRYSDQCTEVEVRAATIGEAFEQLFAVHPGLGSRVLDGEHKVFPYLILLLGTRQVDRAAFAEVPLEDGDRLDIVPAVEGGADVRMRGFRERATFEAALEVALAGSQASVEHIVPTRELAGRVLFADVTSTVDIPAFDRSAMDGYALRAENTFGASTFEPIELELCGESMPGAPSSLAVANNQACRIMTGAPLPAGTDAVAMAEDCEELATSVRVSAPVAPSRNVGRRGEDIRAGARVLRKGRRLRPQDVGLLASIGHRPTAVCRRPRVVVLVTGNELLKSADERRPGFIFDSNTPMLAALLERDGGALVEARHIRDARSEIKDFIAALDCDVLLCAGGASVGREDYLPQIIAELGELEIHGVAMRPSAPTGIGHIGNMRVFLLPGNPVSCLCAYDLFAGPLLRVLGGRDSEYPYPGTSRILSRRIASQIGRLDYVRVAEEEDGCVQPIALSGASILSSTTRAVGFTLVPADSEGADVGSEVLVHLYDGAVRA